MCWRCRGGMTLKTAAADLPLGGGKAVILGRPAEKTEAKLRAMGRAVETLGGRYWTAEDMGMSPADMQVVRRETRFVAGLPDGPYASGDPSPRTARGVFYAMRVAAERRFGSRDLAGRTVAIQGLGHVGWHLAKVVRAAGAELLVSDIDPARAAQGRRDLRGGGRRPGRDPHRAPPTSSRPAPSAASSPRRSRRSSLRASSAAPPTTSWPATGPATSCTSAASFMRRITWPMAAASSNVAAEILQVPDRMHFVTERLSALERMMAHILDSAARAGTGPHRVADRIVAERLGANDAAA